MEQAAPADLDPAGIAIGRIVSAAVEEFDAECFPQAPAPSTGALVRTIDGPLVYATVTSIETAGLDPSRPLVPHGGADDDLESVLAANPHLPLLLRTSFRGRILASGDGSELRYGLPNLPPALFSRVRACNPAELRDFVERMDFLEPLLAATAGEDEVAAAFLRQSSRVEPRAGAFLLEAGRALVQLLGREPDRLTAILRRIRPAGL